MTEHYGTAPEDPDRESPSHVVRGVLSVVPCALLGYDNWTITDENGTTWPVEKKSVHVMPEGVELAFDPDQPRDASGRWGEGGGAPGKGTQARQANAAKAAQMKVVARLNKLRRAEPGAGHTAEHRAASKEYRKLLKEAQVKELAAGLRAPREPNAPREPKLPPGVALETTAAKFESSTVVAGSVKDLGGGVSNTFQLSMRLADGSEAKACYKPQGREPNGYDFVYEYCCKTWGVKPTSPPEREAAVYAIDRALGLGVVPPTVMIKDGPYGRGSVQQWAEPRPTRGEDVKINARMSEPKFNEDALKMALLDHVTLNNDRHGNNFVVTKDGKGDLRAIDNGFAFLFNGRRAQDDPVRAKQRVSYITHEVSREAYKMTDGVRASFNRCQPGTPERASLERDLRRLKTIPPDHIDKFFARLDRARRLVNEGDRFKELL